MSKAVIKETTIIISIIIICGFAISAYAEQVARKNFILPKTFKINDEFLPPLEIKAKTDYKKTVTTTSTNPIVQTTKPSTSVIPLSINNKIPIINKHPETKTTNTVLNNQQEILVNINNVKSVVVQTNPVKSTTLNTTNNVMSLKNLIKKYNSSYPDTLKSVIIALSSMGITPDTYNTDKGQIIAKLQSGKEIFILVAPFNENITSVRITPTNGNYNFQPKIINEIFSEIDDYLTIK